METKNKTVEQTAEKYGGKRADVAALEKCLVQMNKVLANLSERVAYLENMIGR